MSIRLVENNLVDPAQNVAVDTQMLDEAEAAGQAQESLRLWECTKPVVVVGRATKVEQEVFADRCQVYDIPIVERTSGGATIVAGPGCLMYSVILSYELRPPLRLIDQAHEFVLGKTCDALRKLDPRVAISGTSDLTLDGVKFSGNSLRCRRSHLLYHGTILYDFQLDWITGLLRMPPRQPDYREHRSHADFVTNFPASKDEICGVLRDAWLR